MSRCCLADAFGQPAQRFEQAALVQSRRRELEHQRARLQRGIGQHLLAFVEALQLVAIVDAALDRRELHAQADEVLRGAVVQLARELAARAFLGQRDFRGERAQLRVVLRERGFRFAHRGDVAAAAPEAHHVAVLDDADHRDEQHAIEPVRPMHDVLDVAHLVAVADRLADALDIDLRPGRMIAEARADDRALRFLHAERHHERGVALGDVAMFAYPGDLIVGRQRDRHGFGELGAENGLGAVGDEGAIPLIAGARHVDRRVAFGHHRLQQQHRQHAQREESLQFVGTVEGPRPRVVASEATATARPAASAVRRGPLIRAIHTSTG